MAGVDDLRGEPASMESAAEAAPDLTAAAVNDVPPELVAQSMGQYLRAWSVRVRSGDAGVLPVVLALVGVSVVLQIVSPRGLLQKVAAESEVHFLPAIGGG